MPNYSIPTIQPATTQNQQIIPSIPQYQTQSQYNNNVPSVGVYWVLGLEGAKGYQVNVPNAEVYLRDAEDKDILYVKSTDQYGRPNGLRKFRLSEEEIIDSTFTQTGNYVTKQELNDILDDKLNSFIDKINKPQNHNGKRNNGSRRNNNREDNYDAE